MMAGNQYRQQWQQGSAPVQQAYHYDRRDDQRQWQESGRSQKSHNQQEYQGYNGYPKGRNDYGQGLVSTPSDDYEQNWQWQGQDQYSHDGYQSQYADKRNGHPQAPSSDPYSGPDHPSNRTYQYDDRYRNNGHRRPPVEPEFSGSSNGQRPPQHQRPDPSSPHKRSKPRHRILAEPTSPKNLAWDNPFGAFPGKKRPDGKERRASIDNSLGNLSIDDRPHSEESGARPHTSHGHRGLPRKEVHRPSTSHDRPSDFGRPPVQPVHPLPPGRISLEMNRPHQNFASDMGRPSLQEYQSIPRPNPSDLSRPRHNPASDVARPPIQDYQQSPRRNSSDFNRQQQDFRPQGEISPPNLRRTQEPPRGPPPPSTNRDRPHHAPYGSMPRYQSRGGFDMQDEHESQYNGPKEYFTQNDGYLRDYNAPSAPYESPTGPPPSRLPHRPIPQENYKNGPYRAGAPNRAPDYDTRSNDMPNFDAIPLRANEKPEDHINTGQLSSYDPQIYRKPTYQVPGAYPGQVDTTQSKPPTSYDATSPLAEFSFDLPPNVNTRPIPADRNESFGQAPSRRQYSEPRNFETRPPPVGGFGADETQPISVSQYPPRAASRTGTKPPVREAPPLPLNTPGYESFGQQQPPTRPHTSSAQRPPPRSYDTGNSYGLESPEHRAPSAPAGSGPFNQAYNYTGANQQYQAPYGQGRPPRKESQDNYNITGSRSNVSKSAHPVPVRHYPNASAVATAGTGANATATATANINPDALPAHPEPVRQVSNHGYTATQPLAAQPEPRQATAPPPSNANGSNAPQVTVQELNNLRERYRQTPGDHALGLQLAKRLVEGARVLSDEGGKADAKQTQKNRERYIFEGHKLVKKLVAANYPEAMFYLADCHGQGLLGLPVDAKEAFHLYQSAAKLNHAQSAYRVAVCCELGTEEGGGTRRDPLKSMQWYKRAASLGDTPAMYKLGMILLKGLLSQPKNPREGVSWLKRAAERADRDNPHALHELGLLYESATPMDHIIRDEEYAFQLFQQAAELGYKYSQFRLGSAFEYGLLGCPIDPRQSIAWYTRAAAQGEHQSELALSGWYLTGSEPLLTQSDAEAFLWARKAASSGLAKAEYAMGYFNEVGIGTAVDLDEARRWYYRAASQNFGKARERLEEMRRGQKMSKTRVSRSNVNRQSDGECVVM